MEARDREGRMQCTLCLVSWHLPHKWAGHGIHAAGLYQGTHRARGSPSRRGYGSNTRQQKGGVLHSSLSRRGALRARMYSNYPQPSSSTQRGPGHGACCAIDRWRKAIQRCAAGCSDRQRGLTWASQWQATQQWYPGMSITVSSGTQMMPCSSPCHAPSAMLPLPRPPRHAPPATLPLPGTCAGLKRLRCKSRPCRGGSCMIRLLGELRGSCTEQPSCRPQMGGQAEGSHMGGGAIVITATIG